MYKRKRIAVFAADIANDYMNRICAGIEAQAKQLGYDVIVLVMSFNVNHGNAIQAGEENIYYLVKKENIDSIIFLMGNAACPELTERLAEYAKGLNIPVVCIDNEYLGFKGIFSEDTDIFEKITDHFIEHHGRKKIICLTGFEGMIPSESRADGYRRSMEKHGLTVGKDDIIYGDFWRNTASQLADDIVSGRRERPEAVVCANDTMALYLCRALIKQGIVVPDDIMISGYDCSRDAMENVPSITTILPENGLLGARAVAYLHEQMTGEKANIVKLRDSSLIFLGSCGCNDSLGEVIRMRDSIGSKIDNYETYLHNSGMAEGLMQSENLDHLINLLTHYMYILENVDVFMINLCHNWDNFEEQDEKEYLRVGYTEDMDTKAIFSNVGYIFDERKFKSVDIIPNFMSEFSDEPSMYFVMPLHFMDRCFGYTIFKFSNINTTVSNVFSLWNRNINTALEFLRVRTKLTAINQRITLSSIRDTLTGVYNRKGFNRYVDILFKKAKSEGKKFLIIMADLDSLKHINDNYGHVEGDNAITVVANGLNTCCSNNEICARIGGDEYVMVGCYDYTDEIVDSYTSYIHNYFDRYNSSSGKPYDVGASIGLFCGVPEEDKEYSFYMEIADKRMYDNKVMRKKNRTN